VSNPRPERAEPVATDITLTGVRQSCASNGCVNHPAHDHYPTRRNTTDEGHQVTCYMGGTHTWKPSLAHPLTGEMNVDCMALEVAIPSAFVVAGMSNVRLRCANYHKCEGCETCEQLAKRGIR
jgi:hypothetical protein